MNIGPSGERHLNRSAVECIVSNSSDWQLTEVSGQYVLEVTGGACFFSSDFNRSFSSLSGKGNCKFPSR